MKEYYGLKLLTCSTSQQWSSKYFIVEHVRNEAHKFVLASQVRNDAQKLFCWLTKLAIKLNMVNLFNKSTMIIFTCSTSNE